jgi:hypothetical protein
MQASGAYVTPLNRRVMIGSALPFVNSESDVCRDSKISPESDVCVQRCCR